MPDALQVSYGTDGYIFDRLTGRPVAVCYDENQVPHDCLSGAFITAIDASALHGSGHSMMNTGDYLIAAAALWLLVKFAEKR